ncbi:MAG: hypothetical protein WCD04_04575 [Terriglobia bacterium]|jgi:hypothetical protein
MTNQEMAEILELVRESIECSLNAYTIALASMQALEEYDSSFSGRLKTSAITQNRPLMVT